MNEQNPAEVEDLTHSTGMTSGKEEEIHMKISGCNVKT